MYSIVKSTKSDQEIRLPRFVIGHAVRTRNDIESSDRALIPELWQRVVADDVLTNLPGRVGEEYFAVINDYETDQHSHFTKVIGVGVDHLVDIPQDLVAVSIPHKRRNVFEALADMPAALAEAWDRVWEKHPYLPTNRRGGTDIEVHYPDGDILILAAYQDDEEIPE
ncbi:AraC family transcriptional regulator [Actinomycetaceae bacterium WB03_NA08]|uniref:AraC family transcriptional regulator n=1 Tax=Scrofimicrobium canadense TaxID=2652290 RepID=A0A6N7W6N9_9ACTO|nr:effector binding domain-containing protein [Scrofimicrobium canadense]MSS84935.1 AraC family transcriptional regulator [Scrofimicrobium canadense]